DTAGLAKQVAGSGAKPELVAALDDWAVLEPDTSIRDSILGVTRLADPGLWADQFRNLAVWKDNAKLQRLADTAEPASLSPAVLVALADLMQQRKLNPRKLLAAAQFVHPDDFLITQTLARSLLDEDQLNPRELIG